MVNLSTSAYVEAFLHKKPYGWKFLETEMKVEEMNHWKFEEIHLFYWHSVFEKNRIWALYASVIYIVTIFGLQRVMRNRPAFKLKKALFLWNFLLGVFSILGFVRCIPGFLDVFQKENGFFHSICSKVFMDIPGAFWTTAFVLSKLWELGDTVFIVLRKRPLIFLQWYHHIITMNVVWILAPMVEPICRWYCVLNYGVHSLMYPYFAVRALGWRVPTFLANIITTLQLVQMIIGLGVNMLSFYYLKMGYDCVRYPLSIQLFSLVYGSFVILFGNLFYESVYKKGRELNNRKVGKKID